MMVENYLDSSRFNHLLAEMDDLSERICSNNLTAEVMDEED